MPLTKAEIQRVRALRDKREREATGQFVVEGPKVVGELLAAEFPFLQVFATPDWQPSAPAGAVTAVTPAEMSRMSHYPTPSVVLAIGRLVSHPLEPAVLGRGLTLALDGIQDPGNVGTLLRIADWFGYDRVLLSPECADLYNQKVINASMGSFARVITHRVDLAAALASVPVPVLGCDLDGTDVHELLPPAAAVVVIGNEGRGLSAAVAARVTQRITIPRQGRAESLNAAVAAGIVSALLRRPRPGAD